MRSTHRISGSEHKEFGRWLELLFMLLNELLLNVLFIVAPLWLLLLFCAERQLSSAFNSAHVASLSLSDSGVSRDTKLWGEVKKMKSVFYSARNFPHEKLIVCWLRLVDYAFWPPLQHDLKPNKRRKSLGDLFVFRFSFLKLATKLLQKLTLLLKERRRCSVVLDLWMTQSRSICW